MTSERRAERAKKKATREQTRADEAKAKAAKAERRSAEARTRGARAEQHEWCPPTGPAGRRGRRSSPDEYERLTKDEDDDELELD